MINKIVCFIFCTFSVFSQTGIGTTAPINKFEVVAIKADPANSGTTSNGNLRLGASVGTHVLDFGLSNSGTFSWVQSRDKSNYSTLYDLAFNPIGGRVGIGTSAPVATLTIGNSTGTIPGELTLNPTSTSYEGGQINLKKSLVGSTQDWIIDQYGTTSSDARLRIFNVTEANGLSIRENGFVGLGTGTPSVRLQVSGDIIANSIAGSSDVRFKSNINTIQNSLQKVMALRGVSFNWRTSEFPSHQFPRNQTIGFIAQEVEKVLPEVVQSENTPEAYKSVQYDKVVALLVEAIKEQQNQINRLNYRLKQLRKQMIK